MIEHTKNYFVVVDFYGENIFNVNRSLEIRCSGKPTSYLEVY